jgi:hypothetical protein
MFLPLAGWQPPSGEGGFLASAVSRIMDILKTLSFNRRAF